MVKWGTSWKNLGGVSLRKTEAGGNMEGGNRWNHGGGGRGKAVHRALGSSEQPTLGKRKGFVIAL